MKNNKMFLCLFLVLALLLTAGCNAKIGGSTDTTDEPAGNDSTVFSNSDGISESGFWEGIKALDYVEMFNYRAIEIPNNVHYISDDVLQGEIEAMLASYSTSNQVTERVVMDGDTVNIDYVGSVDGVEFEGGSTDGMGTEVTIGVTSYIDDFLEQLIDHTPGETVDIRVTFPDDYHEESLQGKDALFVTNINFIVEGVEAELTDEFVRENLSDRFDWKTVEETKAGIRLELRNKAIQDYISNYFTTEVTVKSVPEKLVEYQKKSMLNYYQEYAGYYGMELEEFISTYEGHSSVDELVEANREGNVSSATYFLVLQAVAEDMKISVGEEDLVDYFSQFSESGDYSEYEEQYGLPYLKWSVLSQKVIDYITENAVLL